MLSNDAAVKEVLQMKRISSSNPGKIIINMSTVAETSRFLSAMYKARQLYIDAPFQEALNRRKMAH
jgi:3-hydroxyisobutyrate dehydrogenase-like beta-hydroxyacid dehydrogenase